MPLMSWPTTTHMPNVYENSSQKRKTRKCDTGQILHTSLSIYNSFFSEFNTFFNFGTTKVFAMVDV